jgi:hypothetical protein
MPNRNFLELEAEGDSDESSDEKEDDGSDLSDLDVDDTIETGNDDQKRTDADGMSEAIDTYHDDVARQLDELNRRTEQREAREAQREVESHRAMMIKRAKHKLVIDSDTEDEELAVKSTPQTKRLRETPADFEKGVAMDIAAPDLTNDLDEEDWLAAYNDDTDKPRDVEPEDTVHDQASFRVSLIPPSNSSELVFAALVVGHVVTAAMICSIRSVPYGHVAFSVAFSKQDLRSIPHALDPNALMHGVIAAYCICVTDPSLCREKTLREQLAFHFGYTVGDFVGRLAASVYTHIQGKCATNDIEGGVPSVSPCDQKVEAIYRRNSLF